jgi:methyl-accepting chemotaxis protein
MNNQRIRFSIFHRALLMSLALVTILIVAFVLVLAELGDMTRTIEGQGIQVDAQNHAIDAQRILVREQQDQQLLQQETFQAYSLYSKFIYWRFDSILTGDRLSTEQGDKAEKQLREKLVLITQLNEDMGEAVDVVAIYLDSFNKKIQETFELVQEEAPRFEITSKVGEAQTHSMAMNAIFEGILETGAGIVQKAGRGVSETGETVAAAAAKVKASSEAVQQQGAALNTDVLIILCVSSIGSVLIGVWLARSITQPIQRLTAVITRIDRDSDLTCRVTDLPAHEIGDIGHAFNRMLEKFNGIVGNMKDTAQDLSHSAVASAKVSQTTSQSAQQLMAEIDQVAAATNEMAATIKGINEHTSDAVQQANTAQAACREGQLIVAKTLEAIKSLEASTVEGVESVRKLAEHSERIGSVLDVIRSIAEQTNLLALNAAIEAARAGDAGRGFAVVADEVRTLAQRTGQSTQEIQSMTEALQQGTQHVVERMNANQGQASSALEKAAGTTAAIDRIIGAVQAIAQTNQNISRATDEQTRAADSIDQSVVRISHLTGDLSHAADQTSASGDQLARLVENLKAVVVQFKS